MAAVVPFASCYGSSPPLHLFGKGPRGGGYMSLFAYRGPHYVPRPRVGGHAPRMTLRQICRMLKLIKQIKKREAAAVGVASRKQVSPSPSAASTGTKCFLNCSRHKRKIKQVG